MNDDLMCSLMMASLIQFQWINEEIINVPINHQSSIFSHR